VGIGAPSSLNKAQTISPRLTTFQYVPLSVIQLKLLIDPSSLIPRYPCMNRSTFPRTGPEHEPWYDLFLSSGPYQII